MVHYPRTDVPLGSEYRAERVGESLRLGNPLSKMSTNLGHDPSLWGRNWYLQPATCGRGDRQGSRSWSRRCLTTMNPGTRIISATSFPLMKLRYPQSLNLGAARV